MTTQLSTTTKEDDFDMYCAKSTPHDINPNILTTPNALTVTIPHVINHQLSSFSRFDSLITSTAPRIGTLQTKDNKPHEILQQLIEWGRQNGAIIHPFLSFGSPTIQSHEDTTTTTNWGVYANNRIPPNEILLQIPSTLCIQPLKRSPIISNQDDVVSQNTTTLPQTTNTAQNNINKPPNNQDNNKTNPKATNNTKTTKNNTKTTKNNTKTTNNNTINTPDTHFYDILTQFTKHVPSILTHLYIALRLLFEYNRLDQSYYKPLLLSQPFEYPYLDVLNPQTLYLHPHKSHYMLQQHVMVIQHSFEGFINQIMTTKYQNKSLYQHLTILFPKYTLDNPQNFISDLIWAYYTAISRSFGNPYETNVDSTVFVPILDMVNHDNIPNCVQYFEQIIDTTPLLVNNTTNNTSNNNNNNNNNHTLSLPHFNVILKSGPNWIEPGEEITFSYTIADYDPVPMPEITASNQDDVVKTLQTSFNIATIFHLSLVRIPYAAVNPAGLIGGKDNAINICSYGMFSPWNSGDILQLRFFRFLHSRSLCPSYDYLANGDEKIESIETNSLDNLPHLTYDDAVVKYILPAYYHHQNDPIFVKRHMDIIQLILTELDIGDITQFTWLGPDYYLIGFCRLLAAGGYYPQSPEEYHRQHDLIPQENSITQVNSDHNSNITTITRLQSREIVKKEIINRTNLVLDKVEERVRLLLGHPAEKIPITNEVNPTKPPQQTKGKGNQNNKNKSKNKNGTHIIKPITTPTKPLYSAIDYLTAFSEELIDEENEYGAMLMLYTLLIHESERCVQHQLNNRNNNRTDKFIIHESASLYRTIQEYYRAVIDGNYIEVLTKQYEYDKKTLVMHGLKVLATRLGLDIADYSNRPDWMEKHWTVFDKR